MDREAVDQVKQVVPVIRERVSETLRIPVDALRNVSSTVLFEKLLLHGRFAEEILRICNRGLARIQKKKTTFDEIKDVIWVVFAAAFYGSSLTKVLSPDN